MKTKYITINPFSFYPITPKDVLDAIPILGNTKSSGRNITLRVLKDGKYFHKSYTNEQIILLKLVSFQTR